jgi:hypothetical protein
MALMRALFTCTGNVSVAGGSDFSINAKEKLGGESENSLTVKVNVALMSTCEKM